MWCYLGDPADAAEALAPVREMEPAFDGIGEAPYPALQRPFDGLYPKGLQWYWRGDFFRTIPDAAVEAHVRFVEGAAHHALDDAPLSRSTARSTGSAFRTRPGRTGTPPTPR